MALTRTCSAKASTPRSSFRSDPKYRGAIEYLFRWNGTETHVLQPGAHAAIIG